MTRAAGCALLGTALLASAALFALPSLYVAGAALLLLGAGAAAWVGLAGRGARVDSVVRSRSVEEGEPLAVAVTGSPGSLPLPGGELVAPALRRRAALAGRRPVELRGHARFDRRGRRALAPARLELRDPLGIAKRSLSAPVDEVLVLPRVEPLRVAAAKGTEGADAGLRRGASAELELESLRPHRPGAPASRIHWPTVARTGELIERRLVADSEGWPLVVLDAAAAASEDALDRAVRAAASLCVALAAAGGCRMLLPGERRGIRIAPDLRAWPALHARLALVRAGGAPPGPRALAAASVLFWVAARPRPPSALARAGAGDRVLVAPDADEPPGCGAVVFTVAGCSGRRLAPTPAGVA